MGVVGRGKRRARKGAGGSLGGGVLLGSGGGVGGRMCRAGGSECLGARLLSDRWT